MTLDNTKPLKPSVITADRESVAAVASAHRFHNKVIGIRDSIGAQFGKASNEFQSVGRKKTTEYKRPTRRSAKTAP